MKYAVVFLSVFLLVGCSSMELAPKQSDASAPAGVKVINPFVANPNILALNEQLQHDYAGSQVQVLRVGNEVKVTYSTDVLFGVGGEALLPTSQASLDVLLNAAKAYPQAKFRVDCFTDKSGSADKNLARSNERAQNVTAYLISHGVTETKVTFKGYGSDYPVVADGTAEGRALNRRVVITLKVPAPHPAA